MGREPDSDDEDDEEEIVSVGGVERPSAPFLKHTAAQGASEAGAAAAAAAAGSHIAASGFAHTAAATIPHNDVPRAPLTGAPLKPSLKKGFLLPSSSASATSTQHAVQPYHQQVEFSLDYIGLQPGMAAQPIGPDK